MIWSSNSKQVGYIGWCMIFDSS